MFADQSASTRRRRSFRLNSFRYQGHGSISMPTSQQKTSIWRYRRLEIRPQNDLSAHEIGSGPSRKYYSVGIDDVL
jgi:hypothetical protein